MRVIVLQANDNEKGEGFFPHLDFQVAMIQDAESLKDAACFNVGSHPDAKERGKPYRVIVIPCEHWTEFDVYSESHKGRDEFVAYLAETPLIQ